MVELQGSLLTLFFLTADVSVPLLFIIPGVSLIVTLLAIARHIKAKKKPSRATVIFLAFGGGFLLTSLAMMLMGKFDLSPYLFGVGSSVLCPVSIGLSALCLIIGSLLLMSHKLLFAVAPRPSLGKVDPMRTASPGGQYCDKLLFLGYGLRRPKPLKTFLFRFLKGC